MPECAKMLQVSRRSMEEAPAQGFSKVKLQRFENLRNPFCTRLERENEVTESNPIGGTM